MIEATKGRLLLVTAPSGAGKTTLVKHLLARVPRARFSVSYTTRRQRPAETDGIDYFFIDAGQFDTMATSGEFLEYAEVFDHWYGTGRRHVESLIERGSIVVLEIDWQGASQVRRQVPDALSVFILPPSLSELERRLRGRASDSDAVIARRLRDARSDMSHWREFRYVIINDDLNEAVDQLVAIAMGDARVPTTDDQDVQQRVAAILAGD
jgi:guanylate kinase